MASEVDVHLWTDQQSYGPGQKVGIYSYVHNHSVRTCTVPYDSCGDAMTITEDDTGRIVYDQNPPGMGRPCYLKGTTLAPGESTGISGTSWYQQRGCYGPPGSAQPCPAPQAPPGGYTVHQPWVVQLTATFAIASH